MNDTVIETPKTPFPSNSTCVFQAITQSGIEEQISHMLAEFDSLVPEQYEGYDRPYQPLSRRMELFEKHIPFGQMVIYTEILDGSKANNYVFCRATLYILTQEGYHPLHSRLGEGSVNTARTDGPFAEAETSAIRRILISIGLSNDGGKDEIRVLNNNAERDHLTNYLQEVGKTLDALIKAYNAEEPSNRIADSGKGGGLTVASLAPAHVIALREYIAKR